MNANRLKKITELKKELASLALRTEKLTEKKGKLAEDEYSALSAEYKKRIKQINLELADLKKGASAELSAAAKQISALDRESASLEKNIDKLEDSTGKEGIAKRKELQQKLKSLHKELALQQKEEAALEQVMDTIAADSPAPKTTREVKTNTQSAAVWSSPLFIGVSIGAFIIIAAAVLFFVFRAHPSIESFDQAAAGTGAPQSEGAEQTQEQPESEAVEVSLSGLINGKNVNMREQPNVTSPVIKQLQKGAQVSISAKKVVSGADDAVLSRQTQLTTQEGKQIKLDAGKGVFIVEENDSAFVVKYAIEDNKTVTGTVAKDAIQRLTGETWYKARNKEGIEGWVYGKYIEVKE